MCGMGVREWGHRAGGRVGRQAHVGSPHQACALQRYACNAKTQHTGPAAPSCSTRARPAAPHPLVDLCGQVALILEAVPHAADGLLHAVETRVHLAQHGCGRQADVREAAAGEEAGEEESGEEERDGEERGGQAEVKRRKRGGSEAVEHRQGLSGGGSGCRAEAGAVGQRQRLHSWRFHAPTHVPTRAFHKMRPTEPPLLHAPSRTHAPHSVLHSPACFPCALETHSSTRPAPPS